MVDSILPVDPFALKNQEPVDLIPTPAPLFPSVDASVPLVQTPAQPTLVDQKKQRLDEVSKTKKMLLGGSDQADTIATALENGNNLANRNQVVLDAAALTPLEFEAKYPGQGEIQNRLTTARNRSDIDALLTRTPTQVVGDAANSIAQGALNSAGGIAALGAGLVNNRAGNAISDALGSATEAMQGVQSDTLNRARRADALAGQLDTQDNREQYEQDVLEDGSTIAGLKRIGRDFGAAVERTVSDPTVLGDVVSQGIGSLAVAGPTGKAVGLAGKGITKVLGDVGKEVIERASMPAAIGLMEGGGAYTQASQEVMDMSYRDLQKNSAYFNELLDNGYSLEQAKEAVANRAGLIAGGIQAPIGALTGTLVSRFEASPFRVPSIGSAAGNVVREGIEETIQSGAGQLATNVGVQVADETRDALDEVGSQAAIGGLGGVGTAGAVQTPGAILRGAADSVKAVVGTVVERGNQIREANRKAAPASAEKIDAAVEEAVNQIPAVAEGLYNSAKVENQEQADELVNYVNRVVKTAQITPEEIASLPENVRSFVPETDNRFETLMSVAAVAANPNNDPNDRISAGLFVRQQLRDNEAIFNSDLPSALKGLKEDAPEFEQFNNYKLVLDSINQHPAVRTILDILNESDPLPETQEITPRVVNDSVGMAEFNPSAVNPETNDRILYQADLGQVELSPEQRQAIQASSSLVRAGRQYAVDLQEMGQPIAQTPTMKDVNKQIEKQSSDPQKLSLNQHLSGIIQAAQSNDPKLARTRAQRLSLFAKHMNNKVDALNRSHAAGGQPMTYQSIDPAGKWFEAKQPLTVRANNQGSVNFAQQVYAEAKAAATLVNNIAEIYPEFGLKTVTVPSLVPALKRPVSMQEQQVKATREVPDNRVQEADRRVVEEPVATVTEEVTVEPVEEVAQEVTNAVSTPDNQEPSTTDNRERTEEVSEAVQESEQEASERVRTESEPETGTDETTQPVTVDTQYPDLMNVGGFGNRFKQAFKFPTQILSRLVGEESPLKFLRNVLRNTASFNEVTGQARYAYERPVAKAYREYLQFSPEIIVGMEARLNKVLNTEKTRRKTGEKYTMLSDMQKEGNSFDITTTPRGRAFSILNQDGTYNSALLEQAVAAGLHWAINADRSTYPKGEEDLARDFGIEETQVTEDMVKFFNKGLSLSDAVQSLGSTIKQFWGVQDNKSAPEGYVKGIPEAVAKEILYGLQETGMIQLNAGKELFDHIPEMENRSFPRVWFDERPEEVENLVKVLETAPEVIADAVIAEREAEIYIGEPPKSVAETQMRNPLVKNTKQQKEVIRKANSIPFYKNETMFNLLTSMGEQAVVEFFGGENTEGKVYNKNHLRSIEGKNLGIRNSFKNIAKQVGRLENYAKAQNTEVNNTPTYYQHNISRVGRLHMQGPSNPQSDKLAREVFMSTRTTLDMTKPEDVSKFWMTVAQALGVKTEQLPRATSVQKAQDKILSFESFMPAVRAFVQDGTKLSQETLDDISKKLGKDKSFKAFHALLAVAKLDSLEDASNFEHYLSLEADGKTDGPVNALVHFTAGTFSSDWLKNVGKGGLYFGVRDKTLNAHRNDDPVDLYEDAQLKLSTLQKDFNNMLKADAPEAANMADALFKVMNALSADVSFDGETLTLTRGVTKNPLTITIYGSGINGIAGKVAGGLVDTFYEMISEALQTGQEIDPELEANLELLMNNTVGYSKTKDKWFVKKNSNFKIQGDGDVFTFPKDQLDQFRSNVRVLFVNNMNKAITDMMGESMKTTRTVQSAIQIQSIALKHIFEAEVKARLVETGRKNSEFLSQKELQQIYKDLSQYSPLISTGTQTLLVGGSERRDIVDTEFSTSITEDLSTPAFVFAPQNAGVSGAPYMVISTGDGQMVQNILANPNSPEGILVVFDGVEMKASTIDEDSRKINEAVFDGWMGNPVRNVSDSFNAFLREGPFSVLSGSEQEAMELEIRQALFGRMASENTFEDAMAEITTLQAALKNDADSIQARHEVMDDVELSIDHMASAEAPYTNDGEVLPNDQSAMLSRLNELYGQKLARITKTKPAIATSQDKFSSIGSVDPDTGARTMRTNELKGLSTNDVWTAAVEALDGQGYSVVFGSPEQLSHYEKNNDPENYNPSEYLQYGKTNASKKIIYIANQSEETILHELIHASTIDKVYAHYNGAKLSDQDKDAIVRLEGLMNEWLGQSYEYENRPAYEAYQSAYASVANAMNKGQTAIALNEFMAWSLSNQNLAEVQKKTKVKNPLYRILGAALKALKQLIGINVDDTLFSNIRFNTRVLLSTPNTFINDAASVVLYQSADFGTNNRLSDLRQKFFNKITANIDTTEDPIEKIHQGNDARLAMAQADNVAKEFMARGFAMDMQEASTFQMVHAALATEADLNPASLGRIQELYTHVMKNISVSDFMENPEANDPNDEFNAQEKFNVLSGVFLSKTDAKGRSNLLPAFLALAMVNEEFRSILEHMEIPKAERTEWDSVDAILDNIGNTAMDELSAYMSGERPTAFKKRASDVKDALDALTEALVNQTGDQKTFIENLAQNTVGGFDQWLRDQIQNTARSIGEKTSVLENRTESNFLKHSSKAIGILAGIVNNETSEHVVSGVTSALNRLNIWTPIREITAEIIGRTKDNSKVFDMISLVRSVVQQTRQQFREHLPEKISGHFTKTLSETEWKVLYKGLAKTDLSTLNDILDIDGIIDILADSKNNFKLLISNIESDIKSIEGRRASQIFDKARELATFMNTGKASGNQLRNAYAIANFLGAGGRKTAASQQLIDHIDHLVTLYAVRDLPTDVRETLSTLAQEEKDGMQFAISYLVGQRSDEQAKLVTPVAKLNHYKGYIPSENQTGTTMLVADDDSYTHDRLITLGYTRVADYKGSQAEGRGIKRGYYYSTVNGRAPFNQGVLQTVRTTASGVDPDTGRTIDMTAGAITDPDEIARIIRRFSANGLTQEPLLPVYNEDGDIIAFERSIDPTQLERLNKNQHLAEMIGAWRGRQVEEALATDFNKQLVDNLYDIWNEQKGSRKDEFIDLSRLERTADPVLHDTWSLIPHELRDYIQGVFGGEGFFVRKDMINDAVGYRSASVGDAWTGTTRWKPAVTERFRQAATGVFGNNAYKYMVQAEKFTQNAVMSAKVLIVVKSIVVPVANILSNMYQLSMRGVPVRDILKGTASKTTEINQYIKNRDRQIELEADLRAVGKDIVRERRLKNELQSIKDANKRMSINDLIEAGEFSSISDNVSEEDIALSEGKFTEYLERAVSKLPEGVKTLGRYAFITKDTALFKGLARAVQYGDFIAKATLYEDLRKRKKLSKEEALAQVSEEFVNYNRLAGRSRSYLESIGLLWFWNFKLRSMKVAASMIKNNPVRALMGAVAVPTLPIIGEIGSPVTDNFLAVMADGKLDYSVGPGMGLNSWSLNPWMNMFK